MGASEKKMKEKILSAYYEAVLEHEMEPKSVYKFCKENKLQEADFYTHFASMEAIKETIFKGYFDNTYELISKAADFETATPKHKLLSFYYTFFEVLLLNRSYVLYTLKTQSPRMDQWVVLKGLRTVFKEFATTLIMEGNQNKRPSKFSQNSEKIFSEGAWIQLIFLIKFWLDDTSPGFEKTDVAIEKSVQTAFDLFDTTPLNSLLDFGKFLWKEKTSSY